MDLITLLALIAAAVLFIATIAFYNKSNGLKTELDKRDEETESLKKHAERLRVERDEARQEAKNASSQQPKQNKKERQAPKGEKEKASEATADPEEIVRANAEIKRLKGLLEDARAEVESRKESLRDAQATFARLREENDNLSRDKKDLQRDIEGLKNRANRELERAKERAEEKTQDRDITAANPNIDLEKELRKERARVEEKFAEKIARLEERLKNRDDRDKQREEKKEASEQSRNSRIERQLMEARDFIKKKGADLAVANYRLASLEKAYKAAKSDVELLQDQVAHLKGEVPVYTPKPKESPAPEASTNSVPEAAPEPAKEA